MEPLTYLKALRQWWWLCAIAVLVAATAALMTAPTPAEVEERVERDTRYEAVHTLYRDESEGALPMGLEALELLVTTGELPARVAERLDWDDEPARLVAEFDIQVDHSLGTLRIGATRDDPAEAELWANTYAEETQAYLVDQREETRAQALAAARQRRDELDEEIRELGQQIQEAGGENPGPDQERDPEVVLLLAQRDALTGSYQTAVERLEELQQEDARGGTGMITLQEAVAVPVMAGEDIPIGVPDSRWPRVGAASAIGLVIGLGLILVLDRTDTRIRTRRAAERAFAMPVIAEIPRFTRWSGLPWAPSRPHQLVTVDRPASEAAESFRMLRLSLQLMKRQQRRSAPGENGHTDSPRGRVRPAGSRVRFADSTPGEDPASRADGPATPEPSRGQVVLVTSPTGQDGKTTAVINLAAAYAEIGQRVLIVDCDLRKPDLHVALRQEPSVGITDALAAPAEHGRPIDVAQPTDLDGVSLLQAGFGAKQPWTAKRPDRAVLDELRSHTDVVILDSGPALSVNDPTTLMPAADAVIVVGRSGRTTFDAAERMSELLDRVQAPVLGVALNAVPTRDRTSPRRRKRRGTGESASLRLRRAWPSAQPAGVADEHGEHANGNGKATTSAGRR